MLADPGQKNDIAAKHPEVVEKMRTAYDKFWKEARPLMVNETAPMSPTQPFRVDYQKQLARKGILNWPPPKL
jgi:arylsulfatase